MVFCDPLEKQVEDERGEMEKKSNSDTAGSSKKVHDDKKSGGNSRNVNPGSKLYFPR